MRQKAQSLDSRLHTLHPAPLVVPIRGPRALTFALIGSNPKQSERRSSGGCGVWGDVEVIYVCLIVVFGEIRDLGCHLVGVYSGVVNRLVPLGLSSEYEVKNTYICMLPPPMDPPICGLKGLFV